MLSINSKKRTDQYQNYNFHSIVTTVVLGERFFETAYATNTINAKTLMNENQDIVKKVTKSDKIVRRYNNGSWKQICYHVDKRGKFEKYRSD
jgi:hypothetical protein